MKLERLRRGPGGIEFSPEHDPRLREGLDLRVVEVTENLAGGAAMQAKVMWEHPRIGNANGFAWVPAWGDLLPGDVVRLPKGWNV